MPIFCCRSGLFSVGSGWSRSLGGAARKSAGETAAGVTAGEAIAARGLNDGAAVGDAWPIPNQAFTRSPLLSQCDCRIVKSQRPEACRVARKAFDHSPDLAYFAGWGKGRSTRWRETVAGLASQRMRYLVKRGIPGCTKALWKHLSGQKAHIGVLRRKGPTAQVYWASGAMRCCASSQAFLRIHVQD